MWKHVTSVLARYSGTSLNIMTSELIMLLKCDSHTLSTKNDSVIKNLYKTNNR